MSATVLDRPVVVDPPVTVEAAPLRDAPVPSPASWSPYDAPVHSHPAPTRMDAFVDVATNAASNAAYVVAGVVAACGLAVGTVVVLASEQRRERRYRDQPHTA
jgi:hypothetical protein